MFTAMRRASSTVRCCAPALLSSCPCTWARAFPFASMTRQPPGVRATVQGGGKRRGIARTSNTGARQTRESGSVYSATGSGAICRPLYHTVLR
jgi:hypothetical protein